MESLNPSRCLGEWRDLALAIRCRFKAMPLEQWGVRRAYLHRLKKALDAAGIEIPCPRLTVYAGRTNRGTPRLCPWPSSAGRPAGLLALSVPTAVSARPGY